MDAQPARAASGQVLLLGNDVLARERVTRLLACSLYSVRASALDASAITALSNGHDSDVILAMVATDPREGAAAHSLESVRLASAGTPVIVLSPLGRPGLELTLFERGLYDLVVAPFDEGSLLPTIARAVERERMRAGTTMRPTAPHAVSPIATLEAQEIERALRATGGNVRRAAALLGLGRATLYRRLATLGNAARTLRSERAAVNAPRV